MAKLQTAFAEWVTGRLYVDASGNYRSYALARRIGKTQSHVAQWMRRGRVVAVVGVAMMVVMAMGMDVSHAEMLYYNITKVQPAKPSWPRRLPPSIAPEWRRRAPGWPFPP